MSEINSPSALEIKLDERYKAVLIPDERRLEVFCDDFKCQDWSFDSIMKIAKGISDILSKVFIEEYHWDVIKSLRWDLDFSYDRISKYLNTGFSKSEIEDFKNFGRERQKELYDRFEEWGRTQVPDDGYEFRGQCYFGCSDDGLSDLTAHIVGLGREEFERVMGNPELARQRALKGEYKENFFYSFQ